MENKKNSIIGKSEINANFTIISNGVLSTGISGTAYMVYSYLSSLANNMYNQCYPSYETIANAISKCRETVIKAVKELISLNLITKERRKHHTRHKQNLSNLYKIYAPASSYVENEGSSDKTSDKTSDETSDETNNNSVEERIKKIVANAKNSNNTSNNNATNENQDNYKNKNKGKNKGKTLKQYLENPDELTPLTVSTAKITLRELDNSFGTFCNINRLRFTTEQLADLIDTIRAFEIDEPGTFVGALRDMRANEPTFSTSFAFKRYLEKCIQNYRYKKEKRMNIYSYYRD